MLETGDMAPDFELLSDSGETVRLSDYRGKRVVLFFYPKAATSGCTRQACGFKDNYSTFEENNALVFGLSPDMPDALKKWRDEMDFPYALLSDPEHEVAEAYGVWGEKTNYGRTYMGIIRSHFVVDAEGQLEDVQHNVSPEKSVEEAIRQIEPA
jgi:peroxiredoxin Q/BCP